MGAGCSRRWTLRRETGTEVAASLAVSAAPTAAGPVLEARTPVEVATTAGVHAGQKACGLRTHVPPTIRPFEEAGRARNRYWVVVRDKDGDILPVPRTFTSWSQVRNLVTVSGRSRDRLHPRAVFHAWATQIEAEGYVLGARSALERRRAD